MNQFTRIQVRNRNGNTDVQVVSNGQGNIDIEINETSSPTRGRGQGDAIRVNNLEEFVHAMRQRRTASMKQEIQETQALMHAFQEFAAELQGQNQAMLEELEAGIEEIRNDNSQEKPVLQR